MKSTTANAVHGVSPYMVLRFGTRAVVLFRSHPDTQATMSRSDEDGHVEFDYSGLHYLGMVDLGDDPMPPLGELIAACQSQAPSVLATTTPALIAAREKQ